MSFLSGSTLWNLLWIIPLILVLAIAGGVRRNRLMLKMFGTDERAARFSNASSGKRVFRIVLLSLAALFLAVAAARPSWGKQVMQDSTTGRDLLVLFDVSKSMLSDDVKPSRMDHAKWLVREIVKKNPGDRFGLVAFAGESFLICPLTVDRASFIQLVDDLDTDTIPIGGTNVQLALEDAVKAFEGAQGTHKAVILVTDGDELTGRGASVVGDLAKSQIPIFAVGVGDPSNPAVIRVKDEDGKLRVLTDRDGNPVKSPLNEPQLTELARRTGGLYVRSTAAYSGIDELESRIRMLDRKESENAVSTFRPIERPAYPLAAAIVLLVLFFCVSETRPRSVQFLLALAALLLFAAPTESRAQNAPANAKDQRTQAVAAEPAAEQPAPESVRSASELYNSGLEQQQIEHDDEKARTFYERAIAAAEKEPLVRASSYQNIGVISHLDARSSLQNAAEKLQAQDLNSAGKAVDEAIVKMNKTEELYRESMRSAAGDASVIRNQRILLADRKQAQEMKKQIEDLKKLMEQARQQTQEAHDQQQRENQQNNQDQQQQDRQQQDQQNNQDQQQQDQQNNQDQQQQDRQQQDQQNNQDQQQQDQQQSGEQDRQSSQDRQSEGQQQDQQDRQQSAQDKSRQAEETVSDLEQKASEMNQESQKQAAQQAREEIRKAREEQRQGNGEKAEEHLKNALDTLNRNQQDQDSDEKDSQDKQQQSGDQDKEDEQEGKQGERQQQALPHQEDMQDAREEQGDMDKQQAEAILNMMSKDELDFKDANQMRRPAGLNNRVEKDW